LKKEKTAIKEEVIERFVKNVRHLKVVRTRSMEEEYTKPNTEEYDELFMDMSAFEEKSEDADNAKPFQPLMVPGIGHLEHSMCFMIRKRDCPDRKRRKWRRI